MSTFERYTTRMVQAQVSVVVLLLGLARIGLSQEYPFQNTSLPFPERVKDLVDRLTLDEMVAQMSHGGAESNGPAPAIDRLGIKPYQFGTECLSGDVNAGPATSFPQSLGMGATFNPDIVYAVARATSDEVRAKNNNYTAHGIYSFHTGLSCWSPVVNILRDPRWGRNQETYGECPYLSSLYADANVRGLQGDHPRYIEANAGCKHFDVHGGPENIPVSRFSFNAEVSERDWRTTFLPQFEACARAGTFSFMCSYNSINGIPACANKKLLTDIAREEWNFTGYIVSDQGAIENIMTAHHYTKTEVETAAAAVNAGTCLEDANFEKNVFSYIGEAVKQNLISMDTVKDAVSRLFLTRMRLGEFDPPEMNPYTRLNVSDFIQSPAHRSLALNASLQSVVLLKNNHMFLPLQKTYSKIAVVGPFIDNPTALFGDYAPTPMLEYVVTPLKAITATLKSNIASATGCSDPKCQSYNSDDIKTAATGADLVIVCLGTGNSIEAEGNDRADIELPGQQFQLLKDAVSFSMTGKSNGNCSDRKSQVQYTSGRWTHHVILYATTVDLHAPVALVLYNAGPLNISWAKSNPNVQAILLSYFPAQSAGDALVAVLTGKYNPAGRLPNTWPASLNDVPAITNYTMSQRTYRYSTHQPLYPFGYGLSYTGFAYSGLKVPEKLSTKDNLNVTVSVTNTGVYGGDEAVQVYISWLDASVPTPQIQLVAVKRVFIKADSLLQVNLFVPNRWLAVLDNDYKWTVAPGRLRLYVGGQQPNQATVVPSNVLHTDILLV